MKHLYLIIFICVCFGIESKAQRALLIHRQGGMTDAISTADIDSLEFSNDGNILLIATGGKVIETLTGDILSLNYGQLPSAFSVKYDGGSATIINPYFCQGVSATINGADVTIDNTNTDSEFAFELSGQTTSGSLLYNGAYKTTIVLNDVNITNPNGPAIDIQCGKRVALELKKNTINTLTDGKNGDWKAALYCKGHLEIDKSGTLNITGNTRHAISAKEYIQLKKADGTINILAAKGDGIHCGQYFVANGFNVSIENCEGDGVQAELSEDTEYDADYPNGTLWIQGGNITIKSSASDAAGLKADADIHINQEKAEPVLNVTMSGAGSKGFKAKNINVEAGQITIANSGTALTEGTDVQTAKCISADASANITRGTLQLTATGAGGKCVKSDGTITVGDKENGEGPQLTASTTGAKYSSGSTGGTTGGSTRPGGGTRPGPGGSTSASGSSAKAIKAQGAINVYGGEMTITTTTDGAEGLESKTSINIAGGKHYFKCYDDAINCSGPIAFNGGISVCVSTGNDAIDSNYGRVGAIVIGDGHVLTYTTRGGAEMGFDCDGNNYIQITGKGLAISAGGNQGGSSNSTLSTAAQGYAFVTTTISYQTGRYYTLADNNGNNLVTYSFEGNVSSNCSMFTAPNMIKGTTYTVKYSTVEPTDATTAFHGLYLGSTAKGQSNVTSFTAK